MEGSEVYEKMPGGEKKTLNTKPISLFFFFEKPQRLMVYLAITAASGLRCVSAEARRTLLCVQASGFWQAKPV